MPPPIKHKKSEELEDDKCTESRKQLNKVAKSQKITILRSNAIAVLNKSTLMPFRWLKNVYRCFYCYDMFNEAKDLKAHQSVHVNDNISGMMKNYWEPTVYVDTSNISCKVCLGQFKDLDELVDHLIENHDIVYNKDVKTFIPFRLADTRVFCLECTQPFRTFSRLLLHTNRSHKGQSESLCDTCGQYFKTSTELNRHKESVHEKKAVLCHLCGTNIGSISRMRTHLQRYHNKQYKCFYCTELFPNHYKRSRHMLEVHNLREKVKCSECDMTFVFRSTMLRHLRESHLKERNVVCSLCGFQAFGKGRLSVHMRRHSDERKFSCTICDKAFKAQKNLKQHIKNIHEKSSDGKN